jgi:uncharacterized membrane protein
MSEGAERSPITAISSGRLETFADGVFAIAATLLILDVHAGAGRLSASLVRAWPSYAAYAVSFVTIGIIWINHHTVFMQIDRVDRRFLLINVLFLMMVAFIPFPTALVAAHIRGGSLEPAALTYGITLTVTAGALQRAVVLRRDRCAPAARRCRSSRGERHHPQLPPGALDLLGGDARGAGESDYQYRAVRGDRTVLRAREFDLRPGRGNRVSRTVTTSLHVPGASVRRTAQLTNLDVADTVGGPVVEDPGISPDAEALKVSAKEFEPVIPPQATIWPVIEGELA